MRVPALLVALAAAGGTLLAAAPASALPCPPGFQSEPARVGVVWVTACWPRLDA
jgi:hypothetical protein